jgi:hypothetical protein
MTTPFTPGMSGPEAIAALEELRLAVEASVGSVWAVKTTTYTAAAGDLLLADTTAGPFTITLPPTPEVGDAVRIKGGPAAATNTLTVARNGSTIAGLSENLTVTQNNTDFMLVYGGSTWRI